MTSLPSPSLFSFCALLPHIFSQFYIFFCCFFSTFPFGAHFCCDSLGSHKWAKKNFMTLRILSLCETRLSAFFFVRSALYVFRRWRWPDGTWEIIMITSIAPLSLLVFLVCLSLHWGNYFAQKKAQKHTAESSKTVKSQPTKSRQPGSSRSITKRARKKGSWSWQLLSDDSRKIPRATATNLKRKSRRWFVRRLFCFCLCVLADAVRWRNFFH